jgi:putative nucleotidyltransferase with HDIG domain
MKDVNELIRNIDTLPSLPAVVLRVQSLIAANEKRAEIARVIEQDPAMAARLLRAANSSFFGVRSKVRGVEQALVLLGVRMVRNLLVMTAVHGTLRRFRLSPAFSLNKYWEHSLITAVMSKVLTQRFGGLAADDAFVAGLLHDLGKVTLASLYPDERSALLSPGSGATLAEECAVFDTDHVAVGSALARAWHLPDFAQEAIAFHHDASGRSPVARIVRAGDSIAHWALRRREVGANSDAEGEPEPIPAWVPAAVGSDAETIAALAAEAESALEEATALASA